MGGGDSYTIGPGFWGFVAFFVMAIALWLLVRNMSGRLRRMAYQERQREGTATGPTQAASGDGADGADGADRPAPSGPLDLSSPGRAGASPDDAGRHDRSADADTVSPDDTPRDDTF